MQRTALLLAVALASVFLVIASLGTFLHQQTMMTGMEGMMGEGFGMGIFLWPSVLTASTAVIVFAVAYVLLFPKITYSSETSEKEDTPGSVSAGKLEPMMIVMRTVKADERAVLEVVMKKGGRCLQRDITYSTGLSRLRTHRIVARLAERGIVQVKKFGRTNEISVPVWLKTGGFLTSSTIAGAT